MGSLGSLSPEFELMVTVEGPLYYLGMALHLFWQPTGLSTIHRELLDGHLDSVAVGMPWSAPNALNMAELLKESNFSTASLCLRC